MNSPHFCPHALSFSVNAGSKLESPRFFGIKPFVEHKVDLARISKDLFVILGNRASVPQCTVFKDNIPYCYRKFAWIVEHQSTVPAGDYPNIFLKKSVYRSPSGEKRGADCGNSSNNATDFTKRQRIHLSGSFGPHGAGLKGLA